MAWSVTRVGTRTGTTTVTSFGITTTGSIPAGDLIVVSVTASNVGDTNDLSSVTDSAGNTYVSGGFTCDPGQNTLTAVWYCVNCKALASSSTVTVTFTSSVLTFGQFQGAAVDDVSGAATATPVDQHNGHNSQTAGTWDTNSITTTNATDLLWVADGVNQGGSAAVVNGDCLPASGWTIQTALAAGNSSLDTAYQSVTATGTYKGGGTSGAGNNGNSAVIVAFKAASGGSIVNGSPTFASNSILLDGMTPTPGNSALSVAAQIVETTANPAAEIGNSVLAEREVYEQGNSALAVTGAVILAPATLASNATLAESALIITPATLASNATLAESGQIVAPATQAGASVLALPDAQIVAPATFASGSNVVVTSEATFTSNAALAVTGAVVVAVCAAIANATLTQSAAQVQAPAALAGYSAVAESAQIVAGAIAAQGNSALGQAQIAQPGSCAVSAVALGTVTLSAVALGTVALSAAVAE